MVRAKMSRYYHKVVVDTRKYLKDSERKQGAAETGIDDSCS